MQHFRRQNIAKASCIQLNPKSLNTICNMQFAGLLRVFRWLWFDWRWDPTNNYYKTQPWRNKVYLHLHFDVLMVFNITSIRVLEMVVKNVTSDLTGNLRTHLALVTFLVNVGKGDVSLANWGLYEIHRLGVSLFEWKENNIFHT